MELKEFTNSIIEKIIKKNGFFVKQISSYVPEELKEHRVRFALNQLTPLKVQINFFHNHIKECYKVCDLKMLENSNLYEIHIDFISNTFSMN